ncbi:MAG TPA: hypothetical protein VGC87_23200 [Pyrinomonadaceae bacterium]|jgi:hypothetical protein
MAAKKAPEYALKIYNACEDWDGSRAGAQTMADDIQDILEEEFSAVAKDAAALAEDEDEDDADEDDDEEED